MDYAVAAIIATCASLSVAWFFRTPKEQIDEMQRRMLAEHNELQQRVATLEGSHNALRYESAGNHARNDQALLTLTAAVNKLSDRIDAMMATRHG